MYYDEDRLKTPLIREGKPGSQKFREASWEEALNLVAERLDKVRNEFGPECVALFSHGTGGKMMTHLLKAFGSPNITAPSFAQCRGPREVAFAATFGEEVFLMNEDGPEKLGSLRTGVYSLEKMRELQT